MLGAGVFTVWGPATALAGDGLPIAVALAAAIALLNAFSTASLAAEHPTSGGAYLYGRAELGPWPGFVAGWAFLTGKTASCAAMALAVGLHLAPPGWERPMATAVVVAISCWNLLGAHRTVAVSAVLLAATFTVILAVATVGVLTGSTVPQPRPALGGGILPAAGLIFFAFAGYARVASLGEEVRRPARTIPVAVAISVSVVVGLYLLLATVLLNVIGVGRLATSLTPLMDLVLAADAAWLAPVVGVGATLAATGALVGLQAAMSRTALAMARHGDLPGSLARINPGGSPGPAGLASGAAILLALWLVDLPRAIGVSSVGVLCYYLIANLAATRLGSRSRLPRWLPWLGALGCLLVVGSLPVADLVIGLAVLALGVVAWLAQPAWSSSR